MTYRYLQKLSRIFISGVIRLIKYNLKPEGETDITIKGKPPPLIHIIDEGGFLLQPVVWGKKVAGLNRNAMKAGPILSTIKANIRQRR